MYESHFRAHPTASTPPIPTAQLSVSHSPDREHQLCYLEESTASERDTVKAELLQAVLELEKSLSCEHPVRSDLNTDDSGSQYT